MNDEMNDDWFETRPVLSTANKQICRPVLTKRKAKSWARARSFASVLVGFHRRAS